jgi:hypothetical protein
MLAILSLGIFSSGMIANDAHASALPCDPSIATCIDPDCDPTITSCPPVNPPPQKSYACGGNAASACAPSPPPAPPRMDRNDVVGKESDDGRLMMENLFSLRTDGETGNDNNDKNGNGNDDDGRDNSRVNQNNEQDVKDVEKGSSADDSATNNAELDDSDNNDADQSDDQEIDDVKKGSNAENGGVKQKTFSGLAMEADIVTNDLGPDN